jgi:RHS repeat-associated protein
VTLEGFEYLGLGAVVRRGRPQPGVDLRRYGFAGEGTGEAGDRYFGLDRFGRAGDWRWTTAAGGVGVDRTNYTYDRDGNRTSGYNWLAPARTEYFSYDGLGQLVARHVGPPGPTPPQVRVWGYDAVGNPAAVTTPGAGTSARAYNGQNEVTAVGGVPVSHSPAGQVTQDETGRRYTYDGWGRLVGVTTAAYSPLAGYTYDGLGRRATAAEGGVATTLLYSAGWQVLEERVGGVAKTQYVWSPVYVDALVLRDRDADGNSGTGAGGREERLYALQDANWNTTALVNTSGTVVERYAYDPFGAATVYDSGFTVRGGGSSYGWAVGFQGLRHSTATGLDHARNRDYSPTLGRFVSVDPIGFAGGDQNLFRFVSNGPTGRVDPSGLFVQLAPLAPAAAPAVATPPGAVVALGAAAVVGAYYLGSWIGEGIGSLIAPSYIPPPVRGAPAPRQRYYSAHALDVGRDFNDLMTARDRERRQAQRPAAP